MKPIIRPDWWLPESAATDQTIYQNRRAILKGLGIGSIGAGIALSGAIPAFGDTSDLYHARKNPKYATTLNNRPLTDYKTATTYNNYYEFGTSKKISKNAQALTIEPWPVEIGGLVNNPMTLDFEDLVRKMPIEERVYRHRCVEAWSMVVPWSGFALKELVRLADPKSDAKYVMLTSFNRPDEAKNQYRSRWPFPYVEGLELREATNDLAFMVTGLYGEPLPKQNGAPMRLAVPWKYGFKHNKGITRIDFVSEMPKTFWMASGPSEYGFFANVNPEVPHRRWAQDMERDIGQGGKRIPTLLYNGYADQVASLYAGRDSGRTIFY
jgi:sulfoxide reductase catalytic subunit YedY